MTMKFCRSATALLVGVLTLNGCTNDLWERNSPFHKTTTEKTVAKDNIQAFGVVAKDNTQLEKGSLVMMGKKYWFVVNSKDSAKLKAILDTKLSKRFQMVRQNPKQVYEALPVELKSPEAQTFRSNFCLRYDTQKVAEIAKLKQLAFKPVEIDGKTVYTRCVSAEGHYYATPKNVAEDRRFDTAVPVRIYYVETKTSTDVWKLTGNILKTPLALALDAVGVVIAGSYAVIGEIVDDSRK
jgi:putative membrane protein